MPQLGNNYDFAKFELRNARVQNLSSAPGSPVAGQVYYDTTLNQFGVYNGNSASWNYMGTSTATGDTSSNTSTSVDSEVVLFNGTTGKSVKRATTTGIPKLTAGVLSAAAAGTDYSAGTGGLTTGILKTTTSTGALSVAVAGDFPTLNQNTTGTAANVTGTVAIANGGTGTTSLPTGLLKGAGTGPITAATAGTDYTTPSSTEVVTNKTFTLSTTTFQDATDNTKKAQFSAAGIAASTTRTYAFPDANGTFALTSSNITGTAANVTGTVAIANGGTGLTSLPAGLLKGAGTSAVTAATAGTDYTTPSGTENLNNKTLTAGLTTFVDGTDTSKKAQFNLSALTTATTRTYAVPDASGTFALTTSNITGTAANVTGTVAVANGGTGATSLTGLLKGNGTSAFTVAVAGTDYTTPSSSESPTNKSFNVAGTGNSLTNVPITSFASGVINTSVAMAGAADTNIPSSLAIKTYVDNLTQGLSWKNAVRVATTGDVTVAGSAPNAVDGVTLVAGDRVLVKSQATASQNGIYTVTTLGTGANGTWTRALDNDQSSEFVNATVYVSEGSTLQDTVWTVTTNGPITVGTTAIAWAQVNGGTVPQASTSTAGKVQLATVAQTIAKSDATLAVTPAGLASFARTYTQLIGDGSATAIVVTHNLGNQFVTIQVYNASTNVEVIADPAQTSANTSTITFGVAPTANQYRVVIVG